jgi:hypothetical protein
MKSIKRITSIFKKATMLLVFTFGIGMSSFAAFYNDITTEKGQNITNHRLPSYMNGYYWWTTNFTITGASTNYTGNFQFYSNANGDIIFINPGPVGKYTVSFVLLFEMYEDDPNPLYYYESFTLTVLENCRASAPTLSLGSSSGCNKTLSIASGSLNSSTNWQWYSGSCGGTPVGSGTSITVSPTATTTYYARGEGGCALNGDCGTITVDASPTIPTFSTSSSMCNSTISIASGSLNGAADWKWYSGSCGGTLLGSGTSISVTPSTNTTYYARGEGGCISTPGSCGSILVNAHINIPSFTLSTTANNQYPNTPVSLSAQVQAFPSQRVYLIPVSQLVNVPNSCGGGGYYNNPPNEPGFSWNDIGSGTVTNVKVEFQRGIECDWNGIHSTKLNSVSGSSVSGGSFCSCSTPYISPFTVNFANPSGYNVGGSNQFRIGNISQNFGFAPKTSAFGTGIYARVTVTYGESGSPIYLWTPGNANTSSINVIPDSTTTYTCKVTNSSTGCSDTKTITITVLDCPNLSTAPTTPTLSATSSSICGNQNTTLSIASGSLNGAANWQWYSGSCGGTYVGLGTSITVSPTATTTYYARGAGGCFTLGSCGNTTITVTGPDFPTVTNVYSGNITINTQTQLDSFYNKSNGEKWTKINGLLTLNGNHYSDPITNLCNLSSLVEITGNLNINNFNKSANPTSLSQLAALTTLGCGLNITSNSLLQDATLAGLSSIGCSVNINDNDALLVLNIPSLGSVQGGQFNIKNNPKLELASVSTTASSFSFTGKGSSMNISDNGSTAANALVMNFKKVTILKGALVFNNNDNTGVNNFDNIFTGLTDLSTKWGKLTITNNDYLGTCCIAASVNVGGSGNRHIISGNTGNCLDSATVLANCGVFHKKSTSQSGLSNAFVEYNVYPNPSSGTFNLDVMSNKIGQLNISVTDLMGRTILTESHVISQYTSLPISLTSAASGTYFLKAEMNGEVFVKRIVLNK